MQAFHKLAGVQEASDTPAQPPAPISSNNLQAPTPPPKDTNSLDTQSQKRASLPLNRRPSHRSLRSNRSRKNSASNPPSLLPSPGLPADYPPTPRLPPEHQQSRAQQAAEGEDGEEVEEEDDDFIWGPSHPCFPHPNPHTPALPSTRVIRVKRDWLASGDLYPQYANLYPEILDPLVSDSEFRILITSLNALLQRTFSPFTSRAWVDSLVGAFTGYIWEDLGLAGAKKGEKEIEAFVDRWNRERESRGLEVRLVQLRKTGFMSLDFVVPDPGIDVIQEDDEDGEGEREVQDMSEVLQG